MAPPAHPKEPEPVVMAVARALAQFEPPIIPEIVPGPERVRSYELYAEAVVGALRANGFLPPTDDRPRVTPAEADLRARADAGAARLVDSLRASSAADEQLAISAEINRQIAARRNDPRFRDRLDRLIREHEPVLDLLADHRDDDPGYR